MFDTFECIFDILLLLFRGGTVAATIYIGIFFINNAFIFLGVYVLFGALVLLLYYIICYFFIDE